MNEREKLPEYVKVQDVLDILDQLIPEDAEANHPVHVAYQQVSKLKELEKNAFTRPITESPDPSSDTGA
jgi:hypothetical protein